MTKATSNGAGTLRPGAGTVKTEKTPSKRKGTKPGEAAPETQPNDLKPLTVAVTMPTGLYLQILAMAAYDGQAASDSVAASMAGDVEAWLESGSLAAKKGRPNPRHFLDAFQQGLDSGMHPKFWPPRAAVELDELASGMLRQVCKHGDACRHPGEDPHDLVNAAVTFLLNGEGSGTDMHEGFDLSCGDEALARAKRDRLGSVAGNGHAPVSIAFQGGAAHAINLVAAKTGKSVEEVLQIAVCNDVCSWLFDSDPDHQPEVAAFFGLGKAGE